MTQPTQPRPDLYQSGGTLGPDLPTYVEREADGRLLDALRRHEYCYVLTARQMGKSSLMVRTQQRLGQENIASAIVDLTFLSKGSSEEQWYTGHVDEIADALDLPPAWQTWWDEHRQLAPVQRFGRFLSDHVLERITSDLVIFIDEIDSTIGLPFSDDYFAAIRALHNRRSQDSRLRRLTFALLGVAAPTDLIKDAQRTPFNIGTRIELTDFTWEESAPLLQGLAPEPDLAIKLLERVLFWTGGHPYLSQRTCKEVASWAQREWDPRRVPAVVDDTIKEIFLSDGQRTSDSNLQFVLKALGAPAAGKMSGEERKQLFVYRDIRRGVRVPDDEQDLVRIGLKLSGIVIPGPSGLSVRNRIYATVFDEVWVRSMLDGAGPETVPEPTHDVFVSYSSEDRSWVESVLVPALKAAGLAVASDLDLPPGANWAEELPRMRETSRFFLPVLSPAWATSRGAQEEYALMSNRVGKVVPVLLRPTALPRFLGDIQYADFTDPSRQPDAIRQLIQALGGLPATSAPTPVVPAPAPTTEVKQALLDRIIQELSRDDLVKLASAQFPPLLERITTDTPRDTIATWLVDLAEQTDRFRDLPSLISVAPSLTMAPSRHERRGASHAFVAMPFGRKEDIDFNRVYQELIRPALESAGFTVFRADEELRAGNIRTDMFQELLLADLVVADLSIDNPNVWYELGVRHALRARGVIQIQATRDYLPFDVYVDRSLRYHVKDGGPDPAYLEADRTTLTTFARETAESWYGRKISPVYHLLRYLKEPDWKSLRVDEAREFWAAQDDWERRVQVARRLGRPGDIMVLADEAPSRVLRLEAYRSAAAALLSLGQHKLALEQCERALELDPGDVESRRRKGLLLSRLGRVDASREWLKAVLAEHESDAETWGLLGRVEKEAWIASWRTPDATPEAMRQAAGDEDALLQQAITAYATGFERDPSQFYPGVNAVTLLHLHEHLTAYPADVGPRQAMEGGVRWAALSNLRRNPVDYWARVTVAELAVLDGEPAAVQRAYREAIAVADKNWFALDSSRQQLILLHQLGFRPEVVTAALDVVERALARLGRPEQPERPRQVVLFSGHMIDRLDRRQPRFPADREPIAARAIDDVLGQLGVSTGDLGMCGGANGGDLLFAEACLKRGMSMEIRIPFDEPRFLRESVTFAGEQWRDRFYAVKAHAKARVFVMPEELGPTPASADPFGRNNTWLLYSALAWGDERLRFVCLWDGRGGDGPGGTQHMWLVARARTGRMYRLDTSRLFGLTTPA